MKKNIKYLAAAAMAGLVMTACSNTASTDQAETTAQAQTESGSQAETGGQEALSPQFEKNDDGDIIVEKDSPLPFGKNEKEVEEILGATGERQDPYVDENDTEFDEIDYSMIWFDYENPIVTCFTFMEDSLVKIDLEMDQHVTKELAREIMTGYYGEADSTQISDYGTICIWEDAENDRRFVLIPDEYDRYTVEITSLSDKLSASFGAELPAVEEAPSAAAAMTGEFGSFASVDLDNNPVDQNILKGHKLTMFNIWGTFCTPCLNEMPDLGALNTEYADKGFQIVGIVTDVVNEDGTVSDSQVQVAKEYAEKTGAAYTHLLPTVDLYNIILKDVQGVPTSVFVDENGTILKEVVGARDKAQWQKEIDELLGE